MASVRQVETKLRQVVDRLGEADPKVHTDLERTLAGPRVIQIDVPDLDRSFWSELSGGRIDGVHAGQAERADIRITADSDDLVALIDGKKPLFSSYLAGHVRVQANVSDLMALRRLM
ncbi:MAG: SCP2 sterol-binding domain-containing protein [Actinomycetota bacterium]